jgi:hypothetical protein
MTKALTKFRRRRRWLRVATAIAGALVAAGVCVTLAQAANIYIWQSPPYARDAAAIVIRGKIEVGDEQTFSTLAQRLPEGVVLLNSPGGIVGPALAIAQMVRERGYTTAVLWPDICASMCAVIWLSGAHAVIQRNVGLGFHAAWNLQTGMVDAEATEAIADYLRLLGLTDNQVAYMTLTPPPGVQWATEHDAAALGFQPQRMVCGGVLGRFCTWRTCTAHYCLVTP